MFIFAFVIAMYGIASLCNLLDSFNAHFAPVLNSGSAVVAVAFITAVYTYRRLQAGKEKKDRDDEKPA